jgi:hypothetical protein
VIKTSPKQRDPRRPVDFSVSDDTWTLSGAADARPAWRKSDAGVSRRTAPFDA